MGFLANMLPGARAIRAPLSAGVIAVLAIWLAFQPQDNAELAGHITPLKNVVGTAGVTVLAGIVTYVTGAVVTTTSDFVVQLVIAGGWFKPLAGWLETEVARRDPDQMIVKRDGSIRDGGITERYHRLCDGSGKHGYLKSPRKRMRENILVVHENIRVVQQEWRQVHFRLMEEKPELFSEVDRLESEGEFRIAIARPVAGLGIAAAFRGGSPWLAAAGVAAGVLLARGGVAITGQAERAVADFVLDERVKLPFLDAVEREVNPGLVEL
jgi:hypothetical protein